jgi:hypothetical protein
MEIRRMYLVDADEFKEKGFDTTVEELANKVKKDIINRVKILEMDCNSDVCPKSVVTVTTEYLSEGLKDEPTDEQRSELSALCKIHKRIMDKVNETTDFSETLVYGALICIVTNMMKEIENE